MKHHHNDDSGHARVHDRSHDRSHRHRHGGFERGWGGPRGRGFGGPFEPGQRGGRRAGRGDIRAAVLALLSEEPMHGYQIIQELGERSNGAWTPSPGSIYPALQLLQDEGLVTAAESDGKRVFTLTEAGRTESASRGDGPKPWEEAARAGAGNSPLRGQVGPLMAAVQQVAMAGSPDQVSRAVTLLTATRRELYRILAEDDTVAADDDTATPTA